MDDSPKQAEKILNEQIDDAIVQHQRSNPRLFLSGINAGLEVGFSVFLMATLFSLFQDRLDPASMHLVLAFAYPVGFLFVIIGRSELFTEHTTLAILPVLNRNATVKSLLMLWLLVYLGNLIGGYIFGYIMSVFPGKLGIVDESSFYMIARKLIGHSWLVILGSGILAGWLMGLLSWLTTSAQETISRIIIVFLITIVIGIGGLHHSIVGSIELFSALLTSEEIVLADYLKVQLWSTVGNAIGGVVFVAIIKFSHLNYSSR